MLRKADGYAIITNVDSSHGTQEFDTLSCGHCDYTWHVRPGSGHKRGFCTNCMRATCGKTACQPCVPYLKRLEAQEQAIQRALARQQFLAAVTE